MGELSTRKKQGENRNVGYVAILLKWQSCRDRSSSSGRLPVRQANPNQSLKGGTQGPKAGHAWVSGDAGH